jgi:transcriptional regulator GlxA family with amidase domain
MTQNYMRPIRLADLVAASGMSRRGFTKAFIQQLGRPPGAFMRSARIELAKRLLTKHDVPLKTIAFITGFRSENTFCIAFSRAAGIAPKKFQRQAWLSVYRTVKP